MNHLYRSPDDRIVAGVAGGMAETYDMDPALVRVGWAFLILVTGGLFLLLYLVMVVVVPLRPADAGLWTDGAATGAAEPAGPDGQPGASAPDQPAATTTRSSRTYRAGYYGRRHEHREGAGALAVGLILIVVGASFLLRQYLPSLDFSLIWPVIVIAGGALLVVASLGRSDRQS